MTDDDVIEIIKKYGVPEACTLFLTCKSCPVYNKAKFPSNVYECMNEQLKPWYKKKRKERIDHKKKLKLWDKL